MAVLSNTIHGEVERKLIREANLESYFDVLAMSCELGVRKPRRDIFMWVANRLFLPPSSIIHIGDDVHADVMGALKTGFWAGQYLKDGVEKSPYAHIIITHWLELPEKLEHEIWQEE